MQVLLKPELSLLQRHTYEIINLFLTCVCVNIHNMNKYGDISVIIFIKHLVLEISLSILK